MIADSTVPVSNEVQPDKICDRETSLTVINVEADVAVVDEGSIHTDTSTLSRSTISHRYFFVRDIITAIFHIDSPTNLFRCLFNSNNLLIEPDVISSYLDIKLENELWFARIQDPGGKEECLPSKRYKMSKIISIGPNDSDILFYYDLTSIAVDYVKQMKTMQSNKSGWIKLPVNLPNAKKR